MATLKSSEILKMTKEERERRIDELRLELVKARANASKKGSRIKEIKKMMARLIGAGIKG
jgi:ribosomal protein L29